MRYVAYYRVSTKGQGQSGLGLEAQKKSVKQFINEGNLLHEFIEIESGRKNDRTVLHEAIALCKSEEAVLVIAKLDRLSRNASFTLSLVDSRIKFIAVDMPQATELTIGIMALLAQDEAKRTSERTTSALSSISERIRINGFHISKAGNKVVKLGNPSNLTNEAREKSARIRREESLNNENNRRAYAYASTFKNQTLMMVSIALNINNFKTSTGLEFTPMSVLRLFKLYNS